MVEIIPERGTMAYYRHLHDELHATVKVFEEFVYLRGMEYRIAASKHRGMSWKTPSDLYVLSYVIAGRVMITIRQGDSDVSVMAAEGESPPRMGLHTITGDTWTARQLLCQVIADWPMSEGEQALTLQDNDDVGVGFG